MFDFEPLNEGIMVVTFTKVNGEQRVMRCTKDPRFIPADKIPTGNNVIKSTESMRVFDLDKSDWRSFRIDSVINAEVAYND